MANAAAGDSLVNHIQLYRYLVTGESYDFSVAILGKESQVGELRYPKDNNNVLHMAASFGHVELVKFILEQWPRLFFEGNSKGDLALHSAIKAGQNNTVGVLMDRFHHPHNSGETMELALEWNNEDGNTALHIALENDDEQLAKLLVEVHPRALYVMNRSEICPLYLAIKLEMQELVLNMLIKMQQFKEEANLCLREGKSLLQALISAKKIEILQDMLDNNPQLIDSKDKEGKTALSYAAYMGDLEKARLLFEANRDSAYICDEDGAYPIHQAVFGGHIDVIKLLVSSKLLLNAKGQNIIHVATLTSQANLVFFLLDSMPQIDSLINQKDDKGNTPLHLATLSKHVEVVKILLQDVRVKVGVLNKQGLTAYDLAKKLMLGNKATSVVQKLNAILERAKSGLKCATIDGKLLQLLYDGNINQFSDVLSDRRIQIKDLVSLESGNNILHIAARMNKVTEILRCDEFNRSNIFGVLMEQANNLGDLPIHEATRAGKLGSLHALFEKSSVPAYGLCLRPNIKANTPLHIAVLNHQMDIANYLYDKCPKAAYSLNKDNICPLFLAINYWKSNLVTEMIPKLANNLYDKCLKAAYSLNENICPLSLPINYWKSNLVTEMISGLDEHTIINLLMGAKSVIHVAIRTKRTAILKSLVEKAPQLLLNSLDSKGRSTLSYAAHIGYAKGVKILLNKFPELEFKRDKDEDGSFPIHQATKGGQLEILKLLHPKICLVNNKHQNILHIAAETGNLLVVKYLLGRKEFKELLNTGDIDGNTPLHLAIKGLHYHVVYSLTSKKHTNGAALNNELLTAGDMFEQRLQNLRDQNILSSTQKVVKAMLGRVEGQHSSLSKERGTQRNEDTDKEKELVDAKDKADVPSEMKPEMTSSDRANVLLVVTAFIITVTYAATFTPPGGYNEETGSPVLIDDPNFKYFTYFNNNAFVFAVVSALLLISGAFIPKGLWNALVMGNFYIIIGFVFMVLAFEEGSFLSQSLPARFAPYIFTVLVFPSTTILYHNIWKFTRATTTLHIKLWLQTMPHTQDTHIDYSI